MSFFYRKSPESIILSYQAESAIRERLFEWIERREYRNPKDSIKTFAESAGVTEGEVAAYLRTNLDIKYGVLKCLLRIQDASMLLLLYPHNSLSHICSIIGYSDINLFLRQFRICTRHNPGRWHRRIVKKREAPRPKSDERRPVNPTLKIWCPIYRNY
jgi:AraC-like DNA-binding protein